MRYLLHGLEVEAGVPLQAGPGDLSRPADVTVERGDPSPADAVEVLLEVDDATAGRHFTLSTTEGGWRLDFPGAATLAVDHDVTRLSVHASPALDEQLLGVLLGGPAAVVLAVLRGHSLLHASAVAHPAGAVLFVGARGGGKSTLAALSAHHDVRLLSDDAVRLDPTGSGFVVHRGTTTSRLRTLSGLADDGLRSADGRVLRSGPDPAPATSPLRAVLLPRLSPTYEDVAVHRVSGVELAQSLLAAPALEPTTHHAWTAAAFDLALAVADTVPAYELWVPWRTGEGTGHVEAVRRYVDELARA